MRLGWGAALLVGGLSTGAVAVHGGMQRTTPEGTTPVPIHPRVTHDRPTPDRSGRYGDWHSRIADRVRRSRFTAHVREDAATNARRKRMLPVERAAIRQAAQWNRQLAALDGHPIDNPLPAVRSEELTDPSCWRIPGGGTRAVPVTRAMRTRAARAYLLRTEQRVIRAEIRAFLRRQAAADRRTQRP